MSHSLSRFALLFVFSGLWAAGAMAQPPLIAYGPPSANLPSAGAAMPNPLPGLPRPPDQPASLYQPASVEQVYGCATPECPYFEMDPRLDSPTLPQPGLFFDMDLGLIGSHVSSRVGQFVNPPADVPFTVSVPIARLDWTASPRFEIGERLPSGFGEYIIGYRLLSAAGSGSTNDPLAAPDATATLNSHLQMNVGDLDYASRETSLAPWDMKWRIGLRTADVLFDSRADEPFAAAAAGSGAYERKIFDNFWGIGPKAAVELATPRNSWGLAWSGRLEAALLFGTVHQKFTELGTTPSAGGTYGLSNPQQSPMLGGFLGLDWQPLSRPNLDVLLGYSAEYWWNVGRLSDPDVYNGQSAGEVGLNGPVFRLEYNY